MRWHWQPKRKTTVSWVCFIKGFFLMFTAEVVQVLGIKYYHLACQQMKLHDQRTNWYSTVETMRYRWKLWRKLGPWVVKSNWICRIWKTWEIAITKRDNRHIDLCYEKCKSLTPTIGAKSIVLPLLQFLLFLSLSPLTLWNYNIDYWSCPTPLIFWQ